MQGLTRAEQLELYRAQKKQQLQPKPLSANSIPKTARTPAKPSTLASRTPLKRTLATSRRAVTPIPATSRRAVTPTPLGRKIKSDIIQPVAQPIYSSNLNAIQNANHSNAFSTVQTDPQEAIGLRVELETRSAECTSLRELGMQLQSQLLTMRQELKAQMVVEEQLRGQMQRAAEESDAVLLAKSAQLDELVGVLKDKDELVEALEEVVATLRHEIQRLESKPAEYADMWIHTVRIEELEKDVAERDALLESAKLENKALHAQLSSVSHISSENTGLREELDAALATTSHQFSQLQHSTRQNQALVAENERLSRELETFEECIQHLEWLDREVEEKNDLITSLQGEVLALQAREFADAALHEETQLANAHLTHRINDAVFERDAMADRLDTLESEYRALNVSFLEQSVARDTSLSHETSVALKTKDKELNRLSGDFEQIKQDVGMLRGCWRV